MIEKRLFVLEVNGIRKLEILPDKTLVFGEGVTAETALNLLADNLALTYSEFIEKSDADFTCGWLLRTDDRTRVVVSD